jgi:RsmE family RNA methyltransferase
LNLLLFTAQDRRDDGLLRITDQRLEHLRSVHGAQVGDSVRVGEINGQVGTANILELSDNAALLSDTLIEAPPEKLPVSVILALPRPKMLRRILRAVAEFGVPELHLINSYRVEKSYWQTPVLEAETIHRYLLQGLEQSRDTVLPQVHCHRRFKPFVEDLLPDMLQDRRALLAHPGDWPPCPSGLNDQTTVIIGPEGGFIPYEVDLLQGAGCETVSLGPRILRVENALPFLLAKLF